LTGLMGYFVFRDRAFFFPDIFCWFLFAINHDEDIMSMNHFQSKLFYIIRDICLSSTFLQYFFFQCGLLCLFFVSQTDAVNILHELLDKSTIQLLKKKSIYIKSQLQHKDNKMIGHKSFANRNK
jgi:hypothetical protein